MPPKANNGPVANVAYGMTLTTNKMIQKQFGHAESYKSGTN
jgi:hypothetical protein